MKRSNVAIIYRSPLGRVAGYGRDGKRLFLEDPGFLADSYWIKYQSVLFGAYDNAEWLDAI